MQGVTCIRNYCLAMLAHEVPICKAMHGTAHSGLGWAACSLCGSLEAWQQVAVRAGRTGSGRNTGIMLGKSLVK